MRRLIVLLILTLPLLAVAPAADAAPTCGGKRATLVFGDGDDEVVGTKGNDVIVLGRGDDYFGGDLGGDDLVCGGPGNDVIAIGRGRERAWGGSGDDHLYDVDGIRRTRDWFSGGPGVDSLMFGGSDVYIDATEGREHGHEGDAFSGVEHFEGSTGDDVFIGSAAAEQYLDHGGADRIELGSGDDTATITGPGTVDAGEGDDEIGILSASHPTVDLGPGDDYVQLGFTTATVDGGEGTDGIGFWYGDEGVTVDIAAGSATQQTYGDSVTLGFEDVFGSLGDDVIYGDEGPNRLLGSRGEDSVDGRGGDDLCDGEVVVNC